MSRIKSSDGELSLHFIENQINIKPPHVYLQMVLNKTLRKLWLFREESVLFIKKELRNCLDLRGSGEALTINSLTLKLLHSFHPVESAVGSLGAPIGAGSHSGEAFGAGY